MLSIAQADIQRRIERDNPWWSDGHDPIPEAHRPRRVYFAPFKDLALNFNVRRATILLGPRRVGKTFMIKQLVSEAIKAGMDAKCIIYVSIDTPLYSGTTLEKF